MAQSFQTYLDNLLGKDLFLKSHAPQLQALWKDADFMQLINSIASQAETMSLSFEAEKDLAKRALYELKAYFDYPAYQQIVDTTKKQCFAQNSAAISTYCVMRMLQEGMDFTPILGSDAAGFSSDETASDEQSERLFRLLCSLEGPSLIRQALFQFLCESQSPDVVDRALDKIDFDAFVIREKRGSAARMTSAFWTPDELGVMKVGQLANKVVRTLLEQGAASDEEVANMQNAAYSKRVFDLNLPLLVPADAPHDRARYYVLPLTIKGKEYKLCSQWFETPVNNDRPYLMRWIREHR